jgi:hypothetical protein
MPCLDADRSVFATAAGAGSLVSTQAVPVRTCISSRQGGAREVDFDVLRPGWACAQRCLDLRGQEVHAVLVESSWARITPVRENALRTESTWAGVTVTGFG